MAIGKSTALKRVVFAAFAFTIGIGSMAPQVVTAQLIFKESRDEGYHEHVTPPPPPPPPPPPKVDPPKVPTMTVQPPIYVPPVQTQMDVTKPPVDKPAQVPALPSLGSLINTLPENKFPKLEALKGDGKGILVKAHEDTKYHKSAPCIVQFHDGYILVAVHKPSDTGAVTTPVGDIAITSNSAVILKFANGILRVMNLSACHQHLKAKLHSDLFTNGKEKIISVPPGCELIAGHHKLGRADLHPDDGVLRRRFKVFEMGHLAVSEFSAESVLKNSGLIASMNESSDAKDRALLKDLSKMAAVLNYCNGTQGFTTSTSGLAQGNYSTPHKVH